MIFDKYHKCYRESIEIGFVIAGLQCKGEEIFPMRLKKDCLSCPYLENSKARYFLNNKNKII